jgi:branched-chain amino acid transport system permease protein
VTTFLLLTITGFGLGAMYFLIASGLSLIYGLMGVLNFAHGAFITVGAYGAWWSEAHLLSGVHSPVLRFLLAALLGLAIGGVFAALVELALIRPLYGRHIEQVLVTVGLSLAFVALVQGIRGSDPKPLRRRRSRARTSRMTAGSRSGRRSRCSACCSCSCAGRGTG